MPKKVFTPEQILPKLRQIEVSTAQGKNACLSLGGVNTREPDFVLRPVGIRGGNRVVVEQLFC